MANTARAGQAYTAVGRSSRLLAGLISLCILSCNATYSGETMFHPREVLGPGDILPCKCIINLNPFTHSYNSP